MTCVWSESSYPKTRNSMSSVKLFNNRIVQELFKNIQLQTNDFACNSRICSVDDKGEIA